MDLSGVRQVPYDGETSRPVRPDGVPLHHHRHPSGTLSPTDILDGEDEGVVREVPGGVAPSPSTVYYPGAR